MPTSAPGNSRGGSRRKAARVLRRARAAAAGFTLIELLVVVALVALASAGVALALRDGAQERLEREGLRLATLLEGARAKARAAALPVVWQPTPQQPGQAFRFVGLPAALALPTQWLDGGDAHGEQAIIAEVEGGRGVLTLGPEPLIGAQRVRLRQGARQVLVGTDGLQPFALLPADD